MRNLVKSCATAPRLFGRGLVKVYRYTLSSLVGFECRHLPTCSEYADQAIGRFGLWAGGWLTLARLLRCHPWGTAGLDFVPESLPASARWYLPWRYGRWRGVNDRTQDCAAQDCAAQDCAAQDCAAQDCAAQDCAAQDCAV